MEWLNDISSLSMKLGDETLEKLLVALSVLTPHIASELLEQLLSKELENCEWPTYDPQLAALEEIALMIQVNGKLRGELKIVPGSARELVEPMARALIEKWVEDKKIVNVIFVPDRLINFVIK
jgi:leucyl-tRNA synthetase